MSFYHPELIKTDSNSKSRLEEGIKVGDLARKNFLEGVYIESTNHLEALELTKTAIHKRLTIFEAAFLVDNVLIRTDLLIPEKDSYRLVEVKSSTSIKNYHLDDAAIQAWVMGKAGISPTKTSLAHINNEFVYQGDGDYGGLFSEVDISEKIENAISKVEGWVEDSKLILSSETEPQITPGDQCFTPFTCEFLDYCRPLEVGVEFPVEILPNSKVMAAKLRQQGYKDLRDVPETLLRNPRHLKVRAATISGQSILDLRATSLLKNLSYPRYYLDFETIALTIPIWKGVRPYMQIPFQWSCHIEHEDGRIDHHEFLDTTGNDPRLPFAVSLINVIGESGTVIVYNADFEGARLKELADEFPSLEKPLLKIKERFFDLLHLARNHYYHPDMKGSWSMKKVLPTIAPELDYENLEVSNGMMAQESYREAIDSKISPERFRHIRDAMLKYCERDTLAMVRIAQKWSNA